MRPLLKDHQNTNKYYFPIFAILQTITEKSDYLEKYLTQPYFS